MRRGDEQVVGDEIHIGRIAQIQGKGNVPRQFVFVWRISPVFGVIFSQPCSKVGIDAFQPFPDRFTDGMILGCELDVEPGNVQGRGNGKHANVAVDRGAGLRIVNDLSVRHEQGSPKDGHDRDS